MASNSLGCIFKITTWGESHGKAIGVVIDGCPAGIPLSEEDINQALSYRAPGKTPWVTPRKEPDRAEIYAGIFEGKTTGAPISIIIPNQDQDPSKYEPIKDLLRPGHANYTYFTKYGCFDYRGGGRASARETACRVAAGAVAKKILASLDIQILSYISRIGAIEIASEISVDDGIKKRVLESEIFCPDQNAEISMKMLLDEIKQKGDSLGGVVTFQILGLAAGLGDPVYEKLEANLAKAMLSLPASKGFEIGEGFSASFMQGSQHNDKFILSSDGVNTATNHAGGTLGGISTGMPIVGRVAFKPTSSIQLPQETVDIYGEKSVFQLPRGSRHDPCVAIRAVPVVEAMCALVIVDAVLMNQCIKIGGIS